MSRTTLPKTFLNYDKIRNLARRPAPEASEVDAVLNRASELKGLSSEDAAVLLNIQDSKNLKKLLQTAEKVKQEIYGKRMVLFAPVYTGNSCTNNCLYCSFRAGNKNIDRITLSKEELENEVKALLKEGHKRLLMLCGESAKTPLESTIEAIRTAYAVNHEGSQIKRINVEIAPLTVEEFRLLKKEKIGTYTCFQETYDPQAYGKYHPSGPKSNYEERLYVMDRAMEGGIDDVGIGALFGLADYRFEVLAMMEHGAHLEEKFGCGPHTVSVPRIEPADGAPLTENIPFPVSDEDFRKIIAVIRVAMPYTGIILSTREPEKLRKELFHYGVSQVSAGSRTNPGGYTGGEELNTGQFSLGDHRSLDQVIEGLIDDGYIPSFCTGCYRKGRVGNDFMDLAKPGLIKQFCLPNGMFTFAEHLLDFASPGTREKGFKLIENLIHTEVPEQVRETVDTMLKKVSKGERDLYL